MERLNPNNLNISTLAVIHGLYLCITGLWPIIHMASFLFITGPKEDLWLVETVGILAFVIGFGLLVGGWSKNITFPLSVIAVAAAVGFILVDVIFVWKLIISPIYLLDAVVEFVFFVAWIIYILKTRLWKRRMPAG